MEPRSIRVPAADGLSLHALEWSRDGVPLLLLHGFGNEAHVWDDIAPALAPYYRTLAFDLRGHGDSDRDPEQRYDYDHHVDDLEAVTAALGIDRVVLVGHSFGGRVSALFAGRHPARVAGLVLVDSGPELDARGTLRIRLDVEKSAEPSFSSLAEYRDLLSRNYPAARREVLERMAHHGTRKRNDGRVEPKIDPAWFSRRGELSDAEATAREERLCKEIWGALEALPSPALVIRGAASDVLSPEVADRMAEEALRHGQLAVVAQAGHSVMVDNPEGCRDALTAFVLGDDQEG